MKRQGTSLLAVKTKRRWIGLPEEILFDIFSRLPIKDLSPFRSLSKDWNKFITDPFFVDLHHSRLDTYRKKKLLCSAAPSGFTFDKITNTYKVVCTWQFANGIYGDSFLKTGVEIYILGSGRWRSVEDVPSYFFCPPITSQVFVNRALHGLIRYCRSDSEFDNGIGAKDITSENFRILEEPPRDNSTRSRTLAVLKESLCLIDYTVGQLEEICLWIMKDYGIKKSWTKEYIVETELVRPLRLPCKILRTVKQIYVLFQGDENLGYYDVENEEFKHVRIAGIPWYFKDFEAVVHLGSLISPRTIDGRSAEKSTKTPKRF
ncbi:hypothetical protein AQUCO_05700007v1 [Aquilegia coerulea]|uniref:F-box domain-containing protein n=1 Tax=Aquilegia coerulea TaxID=218851 RepID=A0A2G5CFG6_AQUCA|nr:hypothetical protein AQUCO_05700007v1 [Aquilegia coerulea]